MKNWYKPVKRAADLAGALLLMGILSPLFLLIMLAIAVDSEGGVLFAQSRMGKDGRPFIIFKFRTMYPQAPADTPTGALDDPSRHITPVGRFLRRTSLDELPQLFNILKGDMSFIGPRPVVLAERGVALRAGLHCAPRAPMTAGTVETGTLRFSASVFNTMAEVEQVLRILAAE